MSEHFVCPPELVAVAGRLADASADVIRRYFRQPFQVEEKSDMSPVTVADKETEKALLALLETERPDDGVIGEEFGSRNLDAEFVWVFDPIDGTRAFAAGKPLFGSMIALLRGGLPVLGVIDQPILRERWVGFSGGDTTLNGNVCHTRHCETLRRAIVNLGPQAFPFGNAVSLDAYRRVAKQSLTTSVGGDCYTYGLIASGHLDLCIEHQLKIYDYMPLVPIIEGAGGFVRDWQGRVLTKESIGQVLATGDARLLNEAVALLDGAL